MWIMASAILSSCAFVESTAVKAGDTSPAFGLSYYLPKRIHEISLNAKPVVPKAVADAREALVKQINVVQSAMEAEKPHKLACEDLTRQATHLTVPANKTKIEGETDIACAKFKSAAEITKAAKEALGIKESELQAAIAAAGNPGSPCEHEIAFAVKDRGLVADESRLFTADLHHSALRDDELTLTVNTQGLLTSGKGVSTDRTGDIFTEIAKTIAVLAGNIPGTQTTQLKSVKSDKKPECKPVSMTLVADLLDTTQVGKVNTRLEESGLRMEVCGYGIHLAEKLCPEAGADKKPLYFDLPTANGGMTPGLYYRRELPYIVKIFGTKTDSEDVLLASQLVTLPNRSPVAVVPFRTGSFVKSVNEVTFENGMLTAWNINRPSEALAVAKLPLTVLNSMVGTLTQFLQLRIDYTSEEKNFAAAQIDLLKKLGELQEAIEAQNAGELPVPAP